MFDRTKKAAQKTREAVEFVRQHGKFNDSPTERVRSLLLRFISDPTIPSVIFGAWLTAIINYLIGRAPFVAVVGFGGAFGISLVIYAVGDEVTLALEAAKNTYSETEDTGDMYH